MDVTPQSIRAVQFREKLRGYHPQDVDDFVAAMAGGVEALEQRAKMAESRAAELESRHDATTEAEDSLRRTLVLAQRTADLAIQEAREEAARVMGEVAQQRAEAEAEVAELRSRLRAEAEEEGRSDRERLEAQRAALLADVEALKAHLERERERLRIYFADQLRRVEGGEPGMARAPSMEGPDSVELDADVGPRAEGTSPGSAVTGADDDDDDAAAAGGDQADPPGAAADDATDEAEADAAVAAADDPFLAELRRAVSDDRPLGPRDDALAAATSEGPEDDIDLFSRGDDGAGRFGSRLRRRR